MLLQQIQFIDDPIETAKSLAYCSVHWEVQASTVVRSLLGIINTAPNLAKILPSPNDSGVQYPTQAMIFLTSRASILLTSRETNPTMMRKIVTLAPVEQMPCTIHIA